MLTNRQLEIVALVARDGLSNKAIAHRTGLSVQTVAEHVRNAADRLPGSGRARFKIMVWFFTLRDVES